MSALVKKNLTADLPDEQEAQRLAPAEPVLRRTRLTPDGDDKPTQVDRVLMPAQRQQLRYEVRIG